MSPHVAFRLLLFSTLAHFITCRSFTHQTLAKANLIPRQGNGERPYPGDNTSCDDEDFSKCLESKFNEPSSSDSQEVESVIVETPYENFEIRADTSGCASLDLNAKVGSVVNKDNEIELLADVDTLVAALRYEQQSQASAESTPLEDGITLVQTNAESLRKSAQKFLNLTDSQYSDLITNYKREGIKLGVALLVKDVLLAGTLYGASVVANNQLGAGTKNSALLTGAIGTYALLVATAIYEFLENTLREDALIAKMTFRKLFVLLTLLCTMLGQFIRGGPTLVSNAPSDLLAALPQINEGERLPGLRSGPYSDVESNMARDKICQP